MAREVVVDGVRLGRGVQALMRVDAQRESDIRSQMVERVRGLQVKARVLDGPDDTDDSPVDLFPSDDLGFWLEVRRLTREQLETEGLTAAEVAIMSGWDPEGDSSPEEEIAEAEGSETVARFDESLHPRDDYGRFRKVIARLLDDKDPLSSVRIGRVQVDGNYGQYTVRREGKDLEDLYAFRGTTEDDVIAAIERALKVEPEAQSPEDVAFIAPYRKVFEDVPLPDGYTTAVTYTRRFRDDDDNPTDSMEIEFAVRDATGAEVGHGIRNFRLSDGYAYHNELQIDASAQRRGIGRALYVHSEAEYRKLNLKAIGLYANDVGAYAWAREGFSLAGDRPLSHVFGIHNRKKRLELEGPYGKEAVDAFDEFLKTVKTVQEIAAYGVENAVDGRWLGKDYLIGYPWNAIKLL